MQVTTVTGPIAPEDLGITLMHEHLIIDLCDHRSPFNKGEDFLLNDVDLMAEELMIFKRQGGSTIAEMTNIGMGRDVIALKRIAETSGVHVVAATGYYHDNWYPAYVDRLSANALADIMIQDLTVGVDGTGIRAGIIGEIGTVRHYISPDEERVFRAAGRAQRQVGVALSTHTILGELALEQVALLREEGVDLRRVIIGHLGDTHDLELLEAVAQTGAYVQIDHVGRGLPYPFDQHRVWVITELIRRGYVEHILLSMDICTRSDLRYWGGNGYGYLLSRFIPMLREAGVSEQEIHAMLIENPQRALVY